MIRDFGHHCARLLLLLGVALLAAGPSLASGRAAGAAPETGSIDAGPFQLRYRVEGTGTPAIVIGSSLYYSRAFSQNLRRHLRLVFMDHRGFGVSPGPVDTSAFALPVLVDDVERLRQALGLERVIVIGHSGHAYMALEYAKAYPEHVSHVVMIGISPDLSAASTAAADQYWADSVSPGRKAALEENRRRLPDEELAMLPADRQFIDGYIRDGPRIWYDSHFDSTPLWEDVDLNQEMFDHVWGTLFRDIDITKGLANLEVPVFLALGRYDYLVAPPSSWEPVRPHFRDLTLRVFERSGHTPQLEEHALFDRELLRWLSPHSGRWVANLAKSRRDPNHQFDSATLCLDVDGDTVTVTHGGVNAGGQEESGTVVLEADGTEQTFPEQGPGIVAVTRWNGRRALETVTTRDGATVAEQIYEVSADGRTLTATVRGTDASGRAFDQVIVFDRADDQSH